MYLPTFWKLVQENRKRIVKGMVPWAVPFGFMGKLKF